MKTLIKKIIEYFFLLYTRFKTKEETALDVRDSLSQTVTALILAPERPQELLAASKTWSTLQKIFPDTKFYLFIDKTYIETAVSNKSIQTIPYDYGQIHFFGLPKKQLLESIHSRHFDIVIDFNQEFSLMAAYICRESDAKLRVCLQHPKRDHLFNFQIRPIGNTSMTLKYESLLKYLSVFKSKSSETSHNRITAEV